MSSQLDSHQRYNVLADRLIDLHRSLYPERHEAYWLEQSPEDWPAHWEPGHDLEWDAGTIEWVASGIEDALKAVSLPVDEPLTGLQKLRRDWIAARDGDSNDDEHDAAAAYIEALEAGVMA